MDYDICQDLFVTGSDDKSITLIKLDEQKIIGKISGFNSRVRGVKLI